MTNETLCIVMYTQTVRRPCVVITVNARYALTARCLRQRAIAAKNV